MEPRQRRWRHAYPLLMVLALLLAACGAPGTGGGSSSDPIKIGAIFDLTGATADVGKPYSEGLLAFVDWKNAQGGISGRKIELLNADYGYAVPKAEELYTKYVTQDKVVAFAGWGTGDTEALKGKISQDKIPFISASYSAELGDPAKTPYNFLVGTTYSDQLLIGQAWALQDWKAKGNSGAPKFAYLINDSPFGKSPTEDGKKHSAANGVAEPLIVPIPRGTTDMTPLLTQIKDYGANYVFQQNVSTPAAQALTAAKNLGLLPDMQFVCLNWCANELLISKAADAAEGVVGTIPFSPFGSDGAKTVTDYAKSKNVDLSGREIPYIAGWWSMAILTEGIERTIKDGKEVTGENIKASLEAMKDFSTGSVTAPITFTGSDHRGNKTLKVYQVKGGKWEPITDFLTAQ
ncbi:MAG TPA: ABC transporter substrate-binding protein [Roseiflexaceae bacterium]|nr:ABC transporter substrate-binding protein [Roseiflexaceae bacterium]